MKRFIKPFIDKDTKLFKPNENTLE